MSSTVNPPLGSVAAHSAEVQAGARFEFGANWAAFLRRLTPERIELATRSLQDALCVNDLRGRRFLDIGCGSGLFSLAARRLGASVRSFDYDPESVRCAEALQRRYAPEDPDWVIEHGSVLDREYLDRLGSFDVVYSWGVLHHTGEMWQAITNAASLVRPRGKLYIAIYDDGGAISRRWRLIKRLFNYTPRPLKPLVTVGVFIPRELYSFAGNLAFGRLGAYISKRRNWAQQSARGMSYWHDFVDWLGGYPFEFARPEHVFRFCRDRGFRLAELKTSMSGVSCNEFVFERESAAASTALPLPGHARASAGGLRAARESGAVSTRTGRATARR
jgi:2-polyprenyl-6-hydroxyphenyl methylase/3-demethylubiquinone-9 3-methyltransferase